MGQDAVVLERKKMMLGGRLRWVYLSKCACGAERWLQKSDLDSPMCSACQLRERARKGWLGMLKAHGYHDAICKLAERFKEKPPTQPERIAKYLLEQAGYKCEPQVPWFYKDNNEIEHGFIIDLVVNLGQEVVFVEVNGRYWHKMAERQQRDDRMKAALADQGIRTIFVDDNETHTIVDLIGA